jgi:hypothetical protein
MFDYISSLVWQKHIESLSKLRCNKNEKKIVIVSPFLLGLLKQAGGEYGEPYFQIMNSKKLSKRG